MPSIDDSEAPAMQCKLNLHQYVHTMTPLLAEHRQCIHIPVPVCSYARARFSLLRMRTYPPRIHVAGLTNGFSTQHQGGGKASLPFSGPEQAAIWSVQVHGSLQAFLGDNKFSECVRKQQEIRQCRHTSEAVQQVSTSPSLISFFSFCYAVWFLIPQYTNVILVKIYVSVHKREQQCLYKIARSPE